MQTPRRFKVLFVVAEDWAFISHRLPMAYAAKEMGGDVVVATRVTRHRAEIEAKGFRVIPVAFQRGNTNPITELSVAVALLKIMREERPDIVHNIALKPILDGSLAAIFSPAKHVVNVFTGMGAVFIDDRGHKWLRRILIFFFKTLMRRPNVHVIVQNDDDFSLLAGLSIGTPDRTTKICGSGVDIVEFQASEEPDPPVTATMVSRLLWDKGVGEIIAAARMLKQRGSRVRIVLVGTADPENPKSVDEDTLNEWRKEGIVEFQGHRDDIPAVWRQSHIAILPSYREGLPKSLLEAAACARPLIATDVPGCRELVKHNVNGLLVPAMNAESLAHAIETLAENCEIRTSMGHRARTMIEEAFSDVVVKEKTGQLYEQLLG